MFCNMAPVMGSTRKKLGPNFNIWIRVYRDEDSCGDDSIFEVQAKDV